MAVRCDDSCGARDEGIAAVEFSSDPRRAWRPFAAFGAILIEDVTLELR